MNQRILTIGAIVIAVIFAAAAAFQAQRRLIGAGGGPGGGATRRVSVAGASSGELVNRAKEHEARSEWSQARAVYQDLVAGFSGSPDVMKWQKKSEELNLKLLLSAVVTPKSVLYEVKPGDSLIRIAGEFKTTPELIMKSNNLSDSRIVAGRKLKVWNVPFTIYIDKSENILLLKSAEDIFKTYIISTGVNNSTPAGTFKIIVKLPNPTWFKSGAVVAPGSVDNALGTRWMGFDLKGYGIHGTTEPATLGQQVTQGCVRMRNVDVEELYDIVPSGTEVTIVD